MGLKNIRLFSTLCDNFCLWNREMLTEKDFYDYFAEETISIGFVSTHKPEEPISLTCAKSILSMSSTITKIFF
ncbi:hypothetical protein ACQY1Y_03890 [Microcystis ichthyoblabe FBCC-A1114]|uniref:hypothetical protein n=1 Tax=Microcystis TaxID=1125 RepID=UPI003D2E0DD5